LCRNIMKLLRTGSGKLALAPMGIEIFKKNLYMCYILCFKSYKNDLSFLLSFTVFRHCDKLKDRNMD
jgi:hypothetical protein